MARPHPARLGDRLAAPGPAAARFIADETARVGLRPRPDASVLGGRAAGLHGRSVLLATDTQLASALALIELDGLARRITLCPPDMAEHHLGAICADAEIDAVVADRALPAYGARPVIPPVLSAALHDTAAPLARATEWVLFTSGTTGQPKMVVHDLESLAGHLQPAPAGSAPVVWCTFYDIRRYGGLQVLLRALAGGGSLVLSGASEAPAAMLARAAAHGVTHILGTPTHWRRALMTGQAAMIAPDYVRLSGEVADQAILDRLKATFPDAVVAHAFASTEAGLAFEIRDGRAGFPASLLGAGPTGTELRIVDGALQIRSKRVAARFLGGARPGPAGADGFVDTGDAVEQHGDRCHFAGRKEGIINIGGQKVHPEEIEAVINRHPEVAISLAYARHNPITGAVVAAQIVVKAPPAPAAAAALTGEILRLCRAELPPHKVPATLRIVPSLTVAASGKLARTHA